MDLAGKLLRQHFVDHAVTLDPRLAGEACRHHFNAEMAFAGLGRAGVAGMAMRVVDDFEYLRREGLSQLFRDLMFNAHLRRLHLNRAS
jgi:hypothetical protein